MLINYNEYQGHIPRFIFLPDNKYLAFWDFFMTLVLLFSCIETPIQIAFSENDLSPEWEAVNYTIDVLFLFDIILQFNLALYDDDYALITDRCEIAKTYLMGNFLIDVVSILPFDLMISGGGEAGNLARFARVGRLYKILKLLRLMRLKKVST